jgi:hemolysin III
MKADERLALSHEPSFCIIPLETLHYRTKAMRVFRPTAEELLNTITHAIGLFLSIAGSIFLLGYVLPSGDLWRCTGCGVYSLALVGVYFSSTLSHSASQPNLKRLFRMLDQGFIYLLIVGTFTPFALVFLRSPLWLFFLGLMWTIALFGFLSKTLIAHRVESVAVWIYLILGWMPIIAAVPLVGLVPAVPLWWMLIGGLCYSVGTVFLMNDHRVPQFHAVWHLCVIAGSAFHFFAILNAVALAA